MRFGGSSPSRPTGKLRSPVSYLLLTSQNETGLTKVQVVMDTPIAGLQL
jgi:hypothetical protein